MARKFTTKDKEILAELSNEDSIFNEVAAEFLMRVREYDDESTIILVGHLLIENLIDKIIESKCKSPKIILNDSRTYPFSVKVQILYSMRLIPDYIYNNIIRINKLRNKFSHNIEFNIDPKTALIDFDGLGSADLTHQFGEKKPKTFKRYCSNLCHITINDLCNHMFNIGLNPRRTRNVSMI